MSDTIIAYHVRPSGVRLPIVNDRCGICQCQAIASAPGVVACRIDGDSAKGYETWHSACFDAEQAAWEAAEKVRAKVRASAWQFANDLLDDGAVRGRRGRALDHLRWLADAAGVDDVARQVYREIVSIEDNDQSWFDEYESHLS